jgi:hypothetical protein
MNKIALQEGDRVRRAGGASSLIIYSRFLAVARSFLLGPSILVLLGAITR